jgi:hypothetical protein
MTRLSTLAQIRNLMYNRIHSASLPLHDLTIYVDCAQLVDVRQTPRAQIIWHSDRVHPGLALPKTRQDFFQ